MILTEEAALLGGGGGDGHHKSYVDWPGTEHGVAR